MPNRKTQRKCEGKKYIKIKNKPFYMVDYIQIKKF